MNDEDGIVYPGDESDFDDEFLYPGRYAKFVSFSGLSNFIPENSSIGAVIGHITLTNWGDLEPYDYWSNVDIVILNAGEIPFSIGNQTENGIELILDQALDYESVDKFKVDYYTEYFATPFSEGPHFGSAIINVIDVNEGPVLLSIATTNFDKNIVGGSAVSTLSSIDPDEGDTHTYSLATGDGDADNGAFIINGNQLRAAESPDFEPKSSYSIRIQATDSGGLSLEKAFTLTVNDTNKPEYNVINSAIGKGKLRGTRQADQFTFDQFESFGGKTADRIIRFKPSQGDTIGISTKAFPSLQATDEISFATAANSTELKQLRKEDYDFVYFEKNGRLFFNANGEKKGWGNPEEGGVFAILRGRPELSAEDFTLLA